MYYIITYISYMTWTIRDPQSLGEWWSLAARFPTATSFENFRSFGPFENKRKSNSWRSDRSTSVSPSLRRTAKGVDPAAASLQSTTPDHSQLGGWKPWRSQWITVNYSGLCSPSWSTNVYQCLPCLPGNTRWFPDFWYDSWQLLLLCLDCALRCWRRWASQFVSHKSWWGLGVLQVFSWKDWEGIYIDY